LSIISWVPGCGKIIKEREVGPQHAIDGLALYLAVEQRLGRMAETVIRQYVQTLMTSLEPHRKTEEKTGFKKSK